MSEQYRESIPDVSSSYDLTHREYNRSIKKGRNEVIISVVFVLFLLIVSGLMLILVVGMFVDLSSDPSDKFRSGLAEVTKISLSRDSMSVLPIIATIAIAITVASQSSARAFQELSVEEISGRSERDNYTLEKLSQNQTINILGVALCFGISLASLLYSLILLFSSNILPGVLGVGLAVFLIFECLRLVSTVRGSQLLQVKILARDARKFKSLFVDTVKYGRQKAVYACVAAGGLMALWISAAFADSFTGSLAVLLVELFIFSLFAIVIEITGISLLGVGVVTRVLGRSMVLLIGLMYWLISTQFILVFYIDSRVNDLPLVISGFVSTTCLSVMLILGGLGRTGLGPFRSFGAHYAEVSRLVSSRILSSPGKVDFSVSLAVFAIFSCLCALPFALPYVVFADSAYASYIAPFVVICVVVFISVHARWKFGIDKIFYFALASMLDVLLALKVSGDFSESPILPAVNSLAAVGFLLCLGFVVLIVWRGNSRIDEISTECIWVDNGALRSAVQFRKRLERE